MVESTPSIAEEDENHDDDQYDYDRLQFVVDKGNESSLVKNQHEQLPPPTKTTNGPTSWRLPNMLFNFLSISPQMLANAEERLYQGLKNKYHGQYVRIRGENLIWTVRSLNSPPDAIPIVLIHDFGCASGIWIQNIDFLSARHPLYMFDILGFGRSSRPTFDQNNAISAETKFVESIEDWRIALDLQAKFFLVGHGFGAYLATLYMMRYGQHINKLILLDPWGFNPKPDENQLNLSTPLWIKLLAYITETWTSFSAFRYLGPLGLPLLKFFAPRWKRLAPITTSNEKSDALYEYLYHVNVQSASGDMGFQALASWYGWAKEPIVQVNRTRIENIADEISIIFIYGSRTNVDNAAAHQILLQRGPNNTCVKTIHNAAHFFFMEKPIQFHEVMSEILTELPYGTNSLASRDATITTTQLRERLRKIDSFKRFTWNNTSPQLLADAEMKVFQTLKTSFERRYVSVFQDKETIWTVYSNTNSDNIPLVLVHGFGGGVGLWSLNLDQMCSDRPVYAFDLPGFARSSRRVFSLDPIEAEQQFVDMFEDWRVKMCLNEPFILLGHSFGGFLAASYALKYSKWIKQLVLVDPWGFGRRPVDMWQDERMRRVPTWLRSISTVVMRFSPLAGLRAAGPFGIRVMKYFRPDLRVKFEKLFDDDRIFDYLYHCNAQLPTGEQAFRTISDFLAWAKEPMVERIHLLDEQIPIHFLHGEESWISMEPSKVAQSKRQNIFIDTITEAGHHVYADAPIEFEMYLKRTLLNKEC